MTSGCDDIRPRLGAYDDGELAAAEARAVEQHLAVCADCRADLEATHAADRLLRAHWETADTSAAFAGATDRLMAALDAEPAPAWTAAPAPAPRLSLVRRPAFRWTSGLVAAAATVLIALRLGGVSVLPSARQASAPVPSDAAAPAGHAEVGAIEPRTREAAPAPPAPAPAPKSKTEPVPAVPEPRFAVRGVAPEPRAARYAVPSLTPAAPATTDAPAEPMPALLAERGNDVAGTRGTGVQSHADRSGSRAVGKRVVQSAEAPAGAGIERAVAVPPRPFGIGDSVLGAASLRVLLEREESFLRDEAGELAPADRGDRWRTVGGLRAWLARSTRSRAEADAALAAYQQAMALDPSHRAADAGEVAKLLQIRASLPRE